MHQQVFRLGQSRQVAFQGSVAPVALLAHVPPGRAVIGPFHRQGLATLGDQLDDQAQELAGLRRQLVRGAAQHVMGQAIGADLGGHHR